MQIKCLPKFILGGLIALLLTMTACYAIDNSKYKSKSNNDTIPLLEGGVSITRNPRLITMSLRESDTRQVLRMLADKAGMNIIMHESVSGTVTLDLVNVTLNKAFEYVMVMNNLAYWVDGNTLIVSSKEAAKDLAFSQQKIKTFDVKYENAGRIAEFLNKNIFKLKNPGLSSDDVAISNPNTNQILIVGTDKDFEIARRIINQFDKKVETVMFKVNHLTPGKMAGIVCNKVFKTDDIKDEDSDSEGKGGAKIACSSKDIEGSEVDGTFTSFKSNGLTVMYYPDLGMIGVSGATREQIQMVDEIISQNDVKQPQAILEIAFIELSADNAKELGVTWYANAGNVTMSAVNGTLSINTGVIQDTDSESSTSGVPNPGGFRIAALINARMKSGKGRVLSNPKVLVKNNTESTIDITQEYVSNIQSQISSTTSAGQVVQSMTVETDDYGIKLKIKPTITPDGYVYMDLNPSYSTPTGSFDASSTNQKKEMQLVAERSLELKGVRVKDNETLIIGGIIYEHEAKTVSKVPILGDIPFIGVAFRSTTNKLNKNELIILVTPKIINDDEAVHERM